MAHTFYKFSIYYFCMPSFARHAAIPQKNEVKILNLREKTGEAFGAINLKRNPQGFWNTAFDPVLARILILNDTP